MAVLDILTYPDERLKRRSEPVVSFAEDLQRFIDDLEETMEAGPPSVGIAAPQVGHFQRIVVVDVYGVLNRGKGTKRVVSSSYNGHLILINPEITFREGEVSGREGCLSVPDYTGNVIRAEKIHLAAYDRRGKPQQYICHGFEARAVQHEIDHLQGILFLDRLVSPRELFRRKSYK